MNIVDRLRITDVDTEIGATCHEAAQEIERLREALSEYADHDNWITTGNGFSDLCLHDLDGWHIAEQALKKG